MFSTKITQLLYNFFHGIFHHVTPEMNVSIKSYSGTSGTPEVMVYNIDRYGFDVTLKNGSEYVAGKITYAARAY